MPCACPWPTCRGAAPPRRGAVPALPRPSRRSWARGRPALPDRCAACCRSSRSARRACPAPAWSPAQPAPTAHAPSLGQPTQSVYAWPRVHPAWPAHAWSRKQPACPVLAGPPAQPGDPAPAWYGAPERRAEPMRHPAPPRHPEPTRHPALVRHPVQAGCSAADRGQAPPADASPHRRPVAPALGASASARRPSGRDPRTRRAAERARQPGSARPASLGSSRSSRPPSSNESSTVYSSIAHMFDRMRVRFRCTAEVRHFHATSNRCLRSGSGSASVTREPSDQTRR